MAAGEVKQWLLEYACHKGMRGVVHDLGHSPGSLQKGTSSGGIERLFHSEGRRVHLLMEVRLALLYLETVRESGDIDQFGTVLEVVTELYSAISNKLPFKLFAKIISDLKIMVLFQMLKNEDKMVIAKLNQYFPRSGVSHPSAREEVQKEFRLAEQRFRRFFLKLVVNGKDRDEYLKTRFEMEFGTDFVKVLQDLLGRFIHQVEDLMPRTKIDNIMQKPHVAARLSQQGAPEVELLLDAIEGKKSLTEAKVLELLQQITCKSRPQAVQGSYTSRIFEDCNSSLKDSNLSKELTKNKAHRYSISLSTSGGGQDPSSCVGSSREQVQTSPDQGVCGAQIIEPDSPVQSQSILDGGSDNPILVCDESSVVNTASSKMSPKSGADHKKHLSPQKRSAQDTDKRSPVKKKCHDTTGERRPDRSNTGSIEVICINSSEEYDNVNVKPGVTETNSTDDVVIVGVTQASSSGESSKSVSLLSHKPDHPVENLSSQSPLQPERRYILNYARPPIRKSPQGVHKVSPGKTEQRGSPTADPHPCHDALHDPVATDVVSPRELISPRSDSSGDSFRTCHSEESFENWASPGEQPGCSLNTSDVGVPYITALGRDTGEYGPHIKDTEHVSDSEEEGGDDQSVVPSSYSFNQYAVIRGPVSTLVRMSLPDIGQHGRPEGVRPCIIKLYRTTALDGSDSQIGQHKMYS